MKSHIQEKIDIVWPAFEKALDDEKASGDLGKSLAALKKAFVVRTLEPTATHLVDRGTWAEVSRDRRLEVVDRHHRRYQPVVRGLEELVSTIVISADDLDAATDPGYLIRELIKVALRQQVEYALGVLVDDLMATPAKPADLVVALARQDLNADSNGITVIEHKELARELAGDEAAQKRFDKELGVDPVVKVDDEALKDKMLVVVSQADKAVWSSALDLDLSWDDHDGEAHVSIVSRLHLEVPKSARYLSGVST